MKNPVQLSEKRRKSAKTRSFFMSLLCYWVEHGFLDRFMNDRRTHFFNYSDGKITLNARFVSHSCFRVEDALTKPFNCCVLLLLCLQMHHHTINCTMKYQNQPILVLASLYMAFLWQFLKFTHRIM
jgi:hypothetical protein